MNWRKYVRPDFLFCSSPIFNWPMKNRGLQLSGKKHITWGIWGDICDQIVRQRTEGQGSEGSNPPPNTTQLPCSNGWGDRVDFQWWGAGARQDGFVNSLTFDPLTCGLEGKIRCLTFPGVICSQLRLCYPESVFFTQELDTLAAGQYYLLPHVRPLGTQNICVCCYGHINYLVVVHSNYRTLD